VRLFFVELLSFVKSENKDVINLLVDEEKKHVIYLSELKRKLKNE